MTSATLSLHLPARSIDVHDLPERAAKALLAVWGACTTDSAAAAPRESWRVRRAGSYFELWLPEGVSHRRAEEGAVAAMVEASLYGRLPAWHPDEAILHAATVVTKAGRPVVLLGDSGSGKSSFALEAVRSGWGYVTDELTLTDGVSVRGVSRTIQFDLGPPASELPARLAGLDLESYRVTSSDGVERVQPLYPWRKLHVVREPLAAARTIVVALAGRAERTVIQHLEPAFALAALHEHARPARLHPFSKLVGSRRAFRLSWREPGEALDVLSRAVDALD